jgi:hypothetical protein
MRPVPGWGAASHAHPRVVPERSDGDAEGFRREPGGSAGESRRGDAGLRLRMPAGRFVASSSEFSELASV